MVIQEKSKIEEIIKKSGNTFHSQVVKFLRDHKWQVLVSPYYSDNFTDKPREIDIIAEKEFPINDMGGWLGTLNVNLFVECKYINGNTIFWFDSKDKDRATERIMTDTGMDHPGHNINILEHHYFSDLPVAKLFSSEKSRGEDNELMNRAINQNLNAMIYYRDLGGINVDKTHIDNVLRRVPYPLIVVNSFEKFFKTSMNDDKKIEAITEPFQLEVNYAYVDKLKKSKNEYFLIDFISIDTLETFLSKLEDVEIKAIMNKISFEERQERAKAQTRRNLGNNSAR